MASEFAATAKVKSNSYKIKTYISTHQESSREVSTLSVI